MFRVECRLSAPLSLRRVCRKRGACDSSCGICRIAPLHTREPQKSIATRQPGSRPHAHTHRVIRCAAQTVRARCCSPRGESRELGLSTRRARGAPRCLEAVSSHSSIPRRPHTNARRPPPQGERSSRRLVRPDTCAQACPDSLPCPLILAARQAEGAVGGARALSRAACGQPPPPARARVPSQAPAAGAAELGLEELVGADA